MKHSRSLMTKLFRNVLSVAATSAALLSGNLNVGAQSHVMHEDSPNTHNMLVFGDKKIYLSHLPMFGGVNDKDKTEYASPHRYQVILEASFHRGAKDLQDIYGDDRRKNTSVRIYTLNPEEFVLSRLASGNSPMTAFTAKVFRGHLERGGRVIRGLGDVEVKVNRVIHFRKFDPQASKPAELKYLLFGSAQETFLAHYISQPPDFDQVLSVTVDGHSFTNAELSKGIEVTIPDKGNHASERVKEAQQVTGVTQTADASALTISLKVDKEIYFEEGELLVPPTFDDTPLEQAKN